MPDEKHKITIKSKSATTTKLSGRLSKQEKIAASRKAASIAPHVSAAPVASVASNPNRDAYNNNLENAVKSEKPVDVGQTPPAPVAQSEQNPIEPSNPQEPAEEAQKTGEPAQPPQNPQNPETPQSPKEKTKPPRQSFGDRRQASMAKQAQMKEQFAANGVKNAGRKLAQEFIKNLVKDAALAALNAIVAFFGWPVLIGCAAIFLIFMALLLSWLAIGVSGPPGKTYPTAAPAGSAEVKKINEQVAAGKLVFTDPTDKTYIDEGKADSRMLSALAYVSGLHNHIGVSHIISGYQDLPDAAGDPESDPALSKNVSAHKDGLAADISQIDFLYKANEKSKEKCGAMIAGAAVDVVYYDDTGAELFRQKCKGGSIIGAKLGKDAIPIKVSWQDPKPDNAHVDAGGEDLASLGLDPEVAVVYRTQAQKKVHQVISELLSYPATTDDADRYKVTQLITFSPERDVIPFGAQLDELYGAFRPNNYGLFAMPESWAQIHVGY